MCLQGHKQGSDALDLELQRLVNCHIGAGDRSCVHWRATSALNHSQLPSSESFQFLVKLLFLFCVCVCVWGGCCWCMWVHVEARSHPQVSSDVVYLREELLGAHWVGEASWPEIPRNLTAPSSQCWDCESVPPSCLLCGFWGAVRSLCLCNNWAISSALVIKLLIHPNEQTKWYRVIESWERSW